MSSCTISKEALDDIEKIWLYTYENWSFVLSDLQSGMGGRFYVINYQSIATYFIKKKQLH